MNVTRLGTQLAAVVAIAALALFAAACSEDETTVEPTATNGGGGFATTQVLAPIESVDVLIAESFPPQYFVQVMSGLPSGCAKFSHSDVERDGTTVRIAVFNTVPAPGELIACTAIYGLHESSVALGTDFDPGVEYHVEVNDASTTFVAQ